MQIKCYPFPASPAETDYNVFPKGLENDPLVLFHATLVEGFEAICRDGFKSASDLGIGDLKSVSFAKQSVTALSHAMNLRQNKPGSYCIIVVRYATLDREGLTNNHSDIHDYTRQPPPELIGCCVVPLDYVHC